MDLVAVLTSSVVGDGAIAPLKVGGIHELPLALHRSATVLSTGAASRLGADRWDRDVTGEVALVQRHDRGGALVLVGAAGAAFVVHLVPTDPLVERGQQLTWRATPYIDPWAWYCGPDFPDSDEFVRPWRVVRVRRRTSPLVPLPGSPGTSVADHSRAEVVDVPAVVRWPSEDLDHTTDHLVTLEAYGDHPRVHSTSR